MERLGRRYDTEQRKMRIDSTALRPTRSPKKRATSRLLAAAVICGTLVTAVGNGGSAQAIARELTSVYWGTAQDCYSGAICLNVKRTNACTGTNNRCYMWDPQGQSKDYSLVDDTSFAGDVYSKGERGRNRDGSGRSVCVYRKTKLKSTVKSVPYYGVSWVSLPFTGAKSLVSVPRGAPCL